MVRFLKRLVTATSLGYSSKNVFTNNESPLDANVSITNFSKKFVVAENLVRNGTYNICTDLR